MKENYVHEFDIDKVIEILEDRGSRHCNRDWDGNVVSYGWSEGEIRRAVKDYMSGAWDIELTQRAIEAEKEKLRHRCTEGYIMKPTGSKNDPVYYVIPDMFRHSRYKIGSVVTLFKNSHYGNTTLTLDGTAVSRKPIKQAPYARGISDEEINRLPDRVVATVVAKQYCDHPHYPKTAIILTLGEVDEAHQPVPTHRYECSEGFVEVRNASSKIPPYYTLSMNWGSQKIKVGEKIMLIKCKHNNKVGMIFIDRYGNAMVNETPSKLIPGTVGLSSEMADKMPDTVMATVIAKQHKIKTLIADGVTKKAKITEAVIVFD